VKLVAFAVAEPTETAATIFDSANEARRKGDYARAIFLHRRLQITFPTSREAQVSYGTVGRLLLDRGDAESALVSFDAYRSRGHGPLDEAVIAGRATALERLGRFDEARSAWSALLDAFPDTPYAEHARARLGAASPR
jgi:TolA-binding protein